MIQIFVNNKELLLPSDFTVNITEENPEITSNGEYTLDITLSLLSPQNAIAFEHLNRVNKTNVSKNAEGMMIIDGVTRFGKIIVIKNTDVDVTFQFIAGNSELNYKAKLNDKKIWELEWSSEEAINYDLAEGSLYLGSGLNFVCAPIMVGTKTINDFIMRQSTDALDSSFLKGISGETIMQPYLMYYINKLPVLLGFSLGSNCLSNDSRAKQMYIVNPVNSLNYADALPDLTITEFIEAIESYFNVSFVVDKSTKKMSIVNLQTSISTKSTVNINTVLDSYIRDLSQNQTAVRFGFTKLSYDLSDSVLFKYYKLTDEIISNATIHLFSDFDTVISYYESCPSNLSDTLTILRDQETDTDYFLIKNAAAHFPSINMFRHERNIISDGFIDGVTPLDLTFPWLHLIKINKFKSYGVDNTLEYTFKISPASIVKKTQYTRKDSLFTFNGSSVGQTLLTYQLPTSSNSYYINEGIGFVEFVENGKKDIQRINKLEVALYLGHVNPLNEYLDPLISNNTHLIYAVDAYKYAENDMSISSTLRSWYTYKWVMEYYPMSAIDNYPEFGYNQIYSYQHFLQWISIGWEPNHHPTLRLTGPNSVIEDYHQQSIIDISKEYTFIIEDSHEVNINNIFIINNAKYIPISLEREKSNTSKTVKGKFYKML